MPIPKKGETRSEYVSRAIPVLMDEGHTRSQAIGKAEGMFTFYKSKKKKTRKRNAR
jgi:hypothetical protein